MISIWGTFQGTSGYAKHTSNLASEVAKLTDVRLHSTNGLPVNLSQLSSNDISDNLVAISIPPYWDVFSGSRTNFNGFLVFEGDKLPDYWADIINKDYVKRILVPSTHVETLAKQATTKEIRVVPHGYNPGVFYPKPISHDIFTYGFVGGWSQGKTDRKGFDILLETFCDTFTNNDNVCLRAKLNMAYQDERKVMSELSELNLPEPDKRPKVDLILGNYTDSEMANFYNSCDVMVFPSRGEAFNIPALEAMACKVPVITTNWGGHLDFCKNDNSYLIDCKLKEYVGVDYFYEGIRLAEPSRQDLKKALQIALDNKELLKSKQESINIEDFTWQSSASKLVRLFP